MRKLIWCLLISYIGYEIYDAITLRRDPAFQTYQAFAQALIDDDTLTLKRLADSPSALDSLATSKARKALYAGKRRFRWQRLLSRKQGPNNTLNFRLEQITRLDPPGTDSFFGEKSIVDPQVVTLRDHHGIWKVVLFKDLSSQN